MTKANIIKLYEFYKLLASGELTSVMKSIDPEKGMPPERKQLIISDAKKNLARLTEKFPDLFIEVEDRKEKKAKKEKEKENKE